MSTPRPHDAAGTPATSGTPAQQRPPADVELVDKRLAAQWPDARCELDFTTPFELLVATVLSAQTTDVRVNAVTPELFTRFGSAERLAAASQGELEELLRPLGFFRAKATSLRGLGAALLADHGGQVPATLEELIALPGVGRKTANVVLGNAFGIPGITVDTHVGRLARRLGWTRHKDAVKAERDIGALAPPETWTMLCHRLIFHGRRVCHSRRPACGACVLADVCPSFGAGETEPSAAAELVRIPDGPAAGGSAGTA